MSSNAAKTPQLDPALSGLQELADESAEPQHPLHLIRKVPLHSTENRDSVKRDPTPSTKAPVKRWPPFRQRWPKGLDVRHTKPALAQLEKLFAPIAEARLARYGRFGCEPLSHVDLARAFIDCCRSQVKLPKAEAPRDYAELVALVEASFHASTKETK